MEAVAVTENTIDQTKADRHARSVIDKVRSDYADLSDITHGRHDTTRQRLQAALDFLGQRWCLHPESTLHRNTQQEIPGFLRRRGISILLQNQAH